MWLYPLRVHVAGDDGKAVITVTATRRSSTPLFYAIAIIIGAFMACIGAFFAIGGILLYELLAVPREVARVRDFFLRWDQDSIPAASQGP